MSLRRSLLLLIPTIPAGSRTSISASVPLLRIASVLLAAVALLLTIALLPIPLLLLLLTTIAITPLLLPIRRLLRLTMSPATKLRQESANPTLFSRVPRWQLLLIVALLLSISPALLLLRPSASTLVVAIALPALQRLAARGTSGGAGASVLFGLQLLRVAGVFVEVLVRAGAAAALGAAAVGVVGSESLFGRVAGSSARAGGVGRAAASGGVAGAGVGGWGAWWGVGGGGVGGGGGALPGGLLCVDVYVEPVRTVSKL